MPSYATKVEPRGENISVSPANNSLFELCDIPDTHNITHCKKSKVSVKSCTVDVFGTIMNVLNLKVWTGSNS